MKWVEIITLRCPAKNGRKFASEYLDLVARRGGEGFPKSIDVYHHLVVETDLSIHLHWETEAEPLRESFLGHEISYTLRDLGLLYHSIWIQDWNLE